MQIRKLVSSYVNGNIIDRKAIWAKIFGKIYNRKNYISHDKYLYRNLIDVKSLKSANCVSEKVVLHYMNHEFNFLGTGWVSWNSTTSTSGTAYHPIAWNKDIVSGYEFKQLYMKSTLISGLPKGTDIKIPWEFGRMYHWPQLAIYAINHPEKQDKILVEFNNQMTDFMQNNPVGVGVQFFCAMEVAIRAINLLIAYDILSQIESSILTSEFKNRFERYLYSHLKIIICRLEKNYFTGHTGNHYLSDLCGMLWLCVYFKSKETLMIARTTVGQFLQEINIQFIDSGSNYECSTGYHMLTSEIAGLSFFASNIIAKDLITEREWILLSKIRSVIDVFVARDNKIIQIGDNDSGRILKLNPIYDGNAENCLNVDEIKALLDYFLKQSNASTYGKLLGAFGISYDMDLYFVDERVAQKNINLPNNFIQEHIYRLKYKKKHLTDAFLGRVQSSSYIWDFGLIKIQCEYADIYIRTVPLYEKMDASHAHDDVFSYQIINKECRIKEDLGSIVYTSDREKRDFFSSAEGHNVPIHSKNILNRTDTFTARASALGQIAINENIILVVAEWSGLVHAREFELFEEGIKVTDYSNEDFEINDFEDRYYSLGYGQLYMR